MSEDKVQYLVRDLATTETFSATQVVKDQIRFLRRVLDLNKSEVVRLAIGELYERTVMPKQSIPSPIVNPHPTPPPTPPHFEERKMERGE